MQANTIELDVDVLNNGTTVEQVYTRSEEQMNRTTYRGPTHTLLNRDTLQLYRTPPKRVADDFGVAKSSFKYTLDVTVTNGAGVSVIRPLIIEVNFAVPVGTVEATVLACRQKAVSLLDLDTVMTPLVSLQEI